MTGNPEDQELIDSALFYLPALQGIDWIPIIKSQINFLRNGGLFRGTRDYNRRYAELQSKDPVLLAYYSLLFGYMPRAKPRHPKAEQYFNRLLTLVGERRKNNAWGVQYGA